jgi:two-component system, LytTR family, sensor kinase
LRMENEARFRNAASPDWRRVWAGLLILWAIFAALGTWFNYGLLEARGSPVTWAQSIRMNVVWYGIWGVLLTPAVLFLCSRMPLAKKQWPLFVAAHVILISAIVCFDVLIKALWGTRVFTTMHELPFIPQFKRVFFSQAEPDIQIYLVVAVLSYVVAYYAELRNQEWHQVELENNLVRAELQVLRTQLQPHFLFNALHSVGALVNTDPRAAQSMICSLGDLLRMSLAGQEHPESTLKQELEFLELYLDVQRVRFQDQLATEIKFDADILNAKVPYFLLQPLVENAIKHGVAKRPGSRVEICARKEADMVCVNVVNDDGVSNDDREHKRLGIGLDNIRSRLRILYGTKGRLSTQTLPNGRFEVEVWIPFRTGPRSDLKIYAVTSVA